MLQSIALVLNLKKIRLEMVVAVIVDVLVVVAVFVVAVAVFVAVAAVWFQEASLFIW